MTARMTRRSLLAATAGAVLGEVIRPGDSLAAAFRARSPRVAPEAILFERALATLPAGRAGASVELRRNADLVGVRWSGDAGARVEVRFRDVRGGWSRWAQAGERGHAPEGVGSAGERVGDPIWTGGSTLVQVRSNRALRQASLSCVDVSGGIGACRQTLESGPIAEPAALPLATPSLPAGSGQPPILARRAWAEGMSPPKVAPGYGSVEMAFVHHTENPNGYSRGEVPAMLRAIYVFHRDVRGWDDIGYNFVIDLYGRIFEARAGGIDEPVVGAQAGGYNLVSTGVAILGEFASTQISRPAASALQRLLAWKLSLHGIHCAGRVSVRVNPAGAAYSRFPAGAHVSLPRIAGHRDADTTDCPGDALYGQLPSIRSRADRLARHPARATLALARPQTPGAAPVLTGGLTFLDGTPIADAPIAIQQRSVSRRGEVVQEVVLAQTVTDAQGNWSLTSSGFSPGAGTWLRALCPGAKGVPAAVSDPVRAAGSLSLTPAPAPAPSPPAATPPSP
jgi:hypothetical protein